MIEKIKSLLSYIIIILAVLFVRAYIVTPVRVNGTSMDDTLANGQIMLLFKITKIEREDIVVVSKKVEGNRLIKRIIGLPGERIKCEGGVIYINDEKYDDKYGKGITNDFSEVVIPEGQYFIMGDNRLVSEDSRFFGPVKKEYIDGTADFRLFPITKFGHVK